MEKIQQKTGWMIYPPCLMKTLRNSEVIIILRNHQRDSFQVRPGCDVSYINFTQSPTKPLSNNSIS